MQISPWTSRTKGIGFKPPGCISLVGLPEQNTMDSVAWQKQSFQFRRLEVQDAGAVGFVFEAFFLGLQPAALLCSCILLVLIPLVNHHFYWVRALLLGPYFGFISSLKIFISSHILCYWVPGAFNIWIGVGGHNSTHSILSSVFCFSKKDGVGNV